MSGWTPEELDAIEAADEVEVTSRRANGELRSWRTIWAVRVGGEVIVRAAHGPDTAWFRHARDSGSGRFRAGVLEREVRFAPATAPETEVDAAYTAKYQERYPSITPGMVGEKVHGLSLGVAAAGD